MKKLKKILVVIVAIMMLASVVLVAACGNGNNGGGGNVAVTSVEIVGGNRELYLDATEDLTLTAEVLPTTATDANVIWKSDDPSVTIGLTTGVLELNSVGYAYIVATSVSNPDVYDIIRVTVLDPGPNAEVTKVDIEGVGLTDTNRSLGMYLTVEDPQEDAYTRTLTASVATDPDGYSDYFTVSWESSDPTVVEVIPSSENGVATATALSVGTATITATAGGVSDVIEVEVFEEPDPTEWTRIEAELTAGFLFENPFRTRASVLHTITGGASANQIISSLGGGAQLTRFINASVAGTTDIRLRVANGEAGQAAFTLNSENFTIYVNGVASGTVPTTVIREPNVDRNDWQTITIEGVVLQEGRNEISLTFRNDLYLNVDFIEFNITRLDGTVAGQAFTTPPRVYSAPTCIAPGINQNVILLLGQEIRPVRGSQTQTEPLGHEMSEWSPDPDRSPCPVSGDHYSIRTCTHPDCDEFEETRLGDAHFFGFFTESLDNVAQWASEATPARENLVTFMPSDAFIAIPGGLNNTHAGGALESGEGEHIANISTAGNYVQFDFFAAEDTTVDIALRIANTFSAYPYNMLPMEPLGDFFIFRLYNDSPESLGHFQPEVHPQIVRNPHPDDPNPLGGGPTAEGGNATPDAEHATRLRNRQFMQPVDNAAAIRAQNLERGLTFNFDAVNFPGQDGIDWFAWRYIGVRNVTLTQGLNTIVFRSNPDAPLGGGTTIPNMSRLFMFSEQDNISIIGGTTGLEALEAHDPGARVRNDFLDPIPGEAPYFTASFGAPTTGDLVIGVAITEPIPNLVARLRLEHNGVGFNLAGMSVDQQTAFLVMRDMDIASGGHRLYAAAGDGITITSVAFYTEVAIPPAYNTIFGDATNPDCIINAEWDVFANDTSPRYAERLLRMDAGDATRVGGNFTASGGPGADGAYVGGNPDWSRLTWTFNSEAAATGAHVAFRFAGANWQAAAGGNTDTIGLGDRIEILINGIAVDISAVNLYVAGTGSWHDWTMVVADGVALNAGANTIEIIGFGSGRPNVNTVSVFGTGTTLTLPSA